jgi:hypothetical protein
VHVNPYLEARTICDRCGEVVTIQNTFLLCQECRRLFLHAYSYSKTRGLINYCTRCGRALTLYARYCDRCAYPILDLAFEEEEVEADAA